MAAPIKHVILASASPFRRALLASTGLAFEVQVAPIDETLILAQTPDEVARRRSAAKALAVAALRPETLVIGADQVLSLDGESFDKVDSEAAALTRLGRMAGRSHFLHSGMALAYQGLGGHPPQVLEELVIDVPMKMRPLTEAEIVAYVQSGEWQGSVGCYQYENRGIHLFDGPGADQSTIVGLPLLPLLAMLRRHGVNGLMQPTPPWTLS